MKTNTLAGRALVEAHYRRLPPNRRRCGLVLLPPPRPARLEGRALVEAHYRRLGFSPQQCG